MIKTSWPVLAAIGVASLAGAHAAANRQSYTIAAARVISPGNWHIEFSEGSPEKEMCIGDVQALIQLAHPGLSCSRLVIEDDPQKATLHYSCPGAGWGRTSLTVETPRAIRISSQGIANKQPFAFDAEARRTGACGGQTVRARR